MKNKQFKPKKNNLSLAWEKINTVIERDIALVVLIMLGGLLHSDESGMRGFPVPWFFPSQSAHMHSSFPAFLTSLIVAIAIVVICEIVNAVVKMGSEPDAFRNTSSQSSVYANTYDDTAEFQDIPDTGSFEAKDTSNYSKALRKSQKMFRKAEESLQKPAPPRSHSETKSRGRFALTLVIVIFAATFIFMAAIFAILFSNDTLHDNIANDNYDTEYSDDYDTEYDEADTGSLLGTPFFEDNEYLKAKCDRVLGMLKSGDADGLSKIGDGDVQGLLSLTDWSAAEFERDYRYAVSGDPDSGFIRFYAQNADGEYMVGIKFEGDGLATDEDSANVIGVAACSFKPWQEYDGTDDESWNKFMDSVEAGSVAVGDDRFMGYSILLW